jgi:amino acid permease
MANNSNNPQAMISPRPRKKIFLAILSAACIITAISLLIYYWNPLMGPFQTTLLYYGIIPIMAALFVGLCWWERNSRATAYDQYLALQENQNSAAPEGLKQGDAEAEIE